MATDKEQQDTEPRLRVMTEKGQALFDDKFLNLQEGCTNSWREIEDVIANCDSDNNDRKYLRETEDRVNSMFKQYLRHSQGLADFLARTRTDQSLQKLEHHELQYRIHSDITLKFRDSLHERLLEQAERLSEKSRTSSQASKTPSELLKIRVKAETQQSRLKYLEEQTALEKRKAATDIDIWVSKEKEAAAVANAELNVVEYDRGSQGKCSVGH